MIIIESGIRIKNLAVDKSHWVPNRVGEVGPHLGLRIVDKIICNDKNSNVFRNHNQYHATCTFPGEFVSEREISSSVRSNSARGTNKSA